MIFEGFSHFIKSRQLSVRACWRERAGQTNDYRSFSCENVFGGLIASAIRVFVGDFFIAQAGLKNYIRKGRANFHIIFP